MLLLSESSYPAVEGAAFFNRLMGHVQLSNGVYRTTYPRRFRNLDADVNRILAQYFPSSGPMRIEDWAASTCLTSCEWAEGLFPIFPRLEFVASDRELFLLRIKCRNSGAVFVAESGGCPLQYIRPPMVIRMQPPEPWALPVNRACYFRALRFWNRNAPKWPLPAGWLEDPGNEEPLLRDGCEFRKLPLIHPQAVALARTDARFAIRRHSIFDPAPSPCHVIRTMNILNPDYFPPAEVAAGARSIAGSLHPGGIWIVGRTTQEDPPVHRVSIFRKSASGGLEIVERFGGGSEIEAIALALSL